MKVGSMFAGIGGFDLGFERAGFEVAWCIEWDKHAQAVLRKRFPNAKVYGDIREVDPDALERVDVICGGFPCQDLSVAGKRAGLAGERSGLFHDAMRLVRRLNPSLLVLENVPGLLSSNHGLDFATVLREVGEGWDCEEVAWRVLDSQYFGVAQRRRRVFVVAGSRIGCAEEVLALAEGSSGDSPTRGEAREGVAVDAARCTDGGRIVPALTSKMAKGTGGPSGDECQNLVAQVFRWQNDRDGLIADDVVGLRASTGSSGFHEMNHPIVAQAFRKSRLAQSSEDDETWVDDGLANTLNGFDLGDTRTTHAIAIPIQDGRDLAKAQNGLGIGSDGDPSYTLDRTGAQSIAIGVDVYNGIETGDVAATVTSATGIANASGPKAIAFAQNQVGEIRMSQTMSTIDTTGNASARTTPKIMSGIVVRRLTPVECERLQGFPDGWTDIGTPDKPTADSHRYKQLGNAVTVNVAEWLARRAHKCLSSR